MTCNADLNQLEEHLRDAQQPKKEFHTDKECCYEQICDYQVIGSKYQIYLLIRKCRCGEYITRERFKSVYIPLGDIRSGVELHLTGRCQYSVKRIEGQYVLEKVCVCPRPGPTK